MQALQKYNENFLKALEQLNEQQLRAVNRIEGPVLVIAGPGTGKTQILAARIGKILLESDAQPHNILCLTYTDAGAIAMRKRLFSFIGPDAYRVNIYTFHAFCNDIIQENLEYFGKLSLDAISDLERVEVFTQLIDNFGQGHPLKRYRGDVYYDIRRLQNLFSVMKREHWSVDLVLEKIGDYRAAMDDETSEVYDKFRYKKKYKDKLPGDKKPDYDKELKRLEELKAAINEFPNYQALMRKRNLYDFDDMIVWILDAFKTDENLLLNYQERYQYVLVDEYQDTSGAQNELIYLLISYWDVPNIFVVGDDDQSIYRFQGANVQNIDEYNQRYAEHLERIMLTENYRSSQTILDTARMLIDRNTERIRLENLSKNLKASNPIFTGLEAHPRIQEYQTQLHEFAAVTTKVSALIREGVRPEEIAVIYKEHRSGEELARYFGLAGIPVSAKKKVNILETGFGSKLVSILRYLAFENDIPYSGDELLFHIMHYDFYHIQPIDVAKISVAVRQENMSGREKRSIRSHIAGLGSGQADLFETESLSEIRKLSSDIEYWIKEANNLTLQNLFEKIIVRGGILAYILKSAEKTWLMQILSSLFNFIKEETRRNPEMDLQEFIRTIDLLEQNSLSLDLSQVMFNEQGVNFMTCHGSKGLEFEYVFMTGCNKNVWEGKRKPSTDFKLPDTLFSSKIAGSDEEELRRLFYVAMTRAKSHLYLSYAAHDDKGKDLEASVFLGEILASTDLQISRPEVSEEVLTRFFALNFSEDDKPSIGLIDHNLVDRVLQNYALSVTHLNNYLECPLKFYFQNLVMVPSGKTETLTFGSSIHWALERFFAKIKDNDNEFPPMQNLLDDFDWYMNRNREAFTREQYNRRMEYGHKILPEYYNQYIHSWNKVIVPELNIKNVEVKGIPIKGKVDKLEFDGSCVNVVDYKTGSYDRAKKKFFPPTETDPLGGDYWRQAVFYKILIDNYKLKDWTAISCEFDFIEPDKEKYIKHKVTINAEDIEIVTKQIIETYGRIQNYEFNKGCGKEDCQWCNFVRTNFTRAEGVMQEEEE